MAADPAQAGPRPRRRGPGLKRILMGGRSGDVSRLPRYVWLGTLALAAVWAPITGYLKTAPLSYSSHMSLILPGSGASASVNLADIGQASSYSNSAFASSAVSPTETYKRLLSAGRVREDAADRLGLHPRVFGEPRVRLVDQTAFIHVEMTGPSAEEAQARNAALLEAFMDEIDRLRGDEVDSRQSGGLSAIREYQASVAATRADIARLQAETGLHSAEQYQRQLDELDALAVRIERLQSERERKAAEVNRLEARLGTNAQDAAAILRLNGDSAYLALLESMADASSALAEARSQYGARHPEVVKAQAGYAAAQAKAETYVAALTGGRVALERAVDGGRAALLTELVRFEAERTGLDAELAQLRAHHADEAARLEALAPLAARLEDMQRDFNVAEAVFASAIARTQSSKTDIYASYPLVQVLEDPSLADEPSSPKRKLAIAAGIAASMMLLIVLGLGWMRRSMIEKVLYMKGERP
ncbi:hypothetical protein AVJ23_02435 [Pseudoponticoccus marisrubri]|uniref:Polysaccharide chain length determinant N-terminal domain-containing protein n=1 Tax=Pseudoponticoccus marisrubri TaxID=1685382 RepID=A0A0W7WQR0_9RHOB|nr:hypothetical protein AVJ23_02435 [Pseudoponticoccus marisrubri]